MKPDCSPINQPAKTFMLLLTALMLSVSTAITAQQYQRPPEGSNFVIDFAELLSMDEKDALDIKIMGFYDTASIAVIVVTVKETGSQSINDYASGLSKEWELEAVNKGKAMLLLVKSDTPRQIAVVTANFPDGDDPAPYINDMLRQDIYPLIKRGRFYMALNMGTDMIFPVLTGEVNTGHEASKGTSSEGNPLTIILAAMVLILAVRMVANYRRCRR
ncbi:MAG: TPM domain-containing protein [Bacteroidales bacterium]|nr:TPM domain-containing protein [Bacteroidales bacterium]